MLLQGSLFSAVTAAFTQQWRIMLTPVGLFFPFVQSVGLAVTIAWLGGKGENATALAYALIGASFMQIWNWSVWRTGWSLSDEQFQGTLELMMTTRTPLIVIMFGKMLAVTALMTVSGALVFLIVLAIVQAVPDVAWPLHFVVSLLFALAAVVGTSFIFAPFTFLLAGRGGFFNAILPFGMLVSGFLFPVRLLPPGLETIAHLMPTSWAMDAIIRSIEGSGATSVVHGNWALVVLLTLAYLAGAQYFFAMAEGRVRVTGSLARG